MNKFLFLATFTINLLLSFVISQEDSAILNLTAYPTYLYSEADWPNTCKQGQAQSPIDFPSSDSASVTRSNTVLKIVSADLQLVTGRNLHNLANIKFKVDVSGFGTLKVTKNDVKYSYNISDIHFHALSEHNFQGNPAILEMHIVFMKDTQYMINQGIINDPDPNTILVVGILFNVEGNTNNSFIDKLQVGTFNPVDNLDLSPFVSATKNYFHYSGGLTTPPCLETVNWVVMKKIETMTRAQFDGFKNLILPLYPYGNYRTTKPLYNRTIYYVENSAGGNFGQISLLLIALICSILFN